MSFQSDEIVKRDLLQRDGIEFVEIDIRYPSFKAEGAKGRYQKSIKTINKFYDQISRLCFDYAEKKLFVNAVAEYDSDPNPRKRFTHRRYVYSIRYKITFTSVNFISVRIDTTLHMGGRRLSFRRSAQTWDLRRGRLCPAYLFASPDKKAKKLIVGKEGGFYLEDGRVVVFTNPTGDKGYREIPLPRTQS